MGVKQRKKRNPLGIAIALTVAALAVALTVWFVAARGDFSLFGMFDRLFFKDDDTTEEAENAIVYTLNNANEFGIDDELEEALFEHFRLYYEAEDEIYVEIRYIKAVFEGTYAVVELTANDTAYIFDLRQRQNKWHIIAHEIATP